MSPASTSVVESLPTAVPAGEFSGTVFAERAMSAGASLTSATAIVSVFSAYRPPASVERTRTV